MVFRGNDDLRGIGDRDRNDVINLEREKRVTKGRIKWSKAETVVFMNLHTCRFTLSEDSRSEK